MTKTSFSAAAGVVLALAFPVSAFAQDSPSAEVTFTKDIAPLLQRSCQKCHRPNALAPMALIDYEEVRPWARGIKHRTGLRDKPGVMPPWYIEKDVGIQRFKGDPSLSDEEIRTIATWVDNGAPEGDPADLPPPREFLDADEWEIGEPDLIVSSPSFVVKRNAPDWWGPIGVSPTGLTEDRYVAALEYKEVTESVEGERRDTVGGLFVVHHAAVTPIGPEASGDSARARPQPRQDADRMLANGPAPRRKTDNALDSTSGPSTRSAATPTSSIRKRAGCWRPTRS